MVYWSECEHLLSHKGDCLLCFWLIGKPSGDFLDGGIGVGVDIAKSWIVD